MAGLLKCLFLLSAAVAASGYALGDTDVVFHLFSSNNPSQSQLLYPTMASIVMSGFSTSRRTIISIHGHGEPVNGNFNAFLVRDHLAAEDVNILAVDWSAGSSMYTQGIANAPQVGERIASFVNILWREFLYNPTNVRIVGHGLGAHIAGIAAKHIDVKLPHIVALDPSFVGWTHHPDRLSADVADVVEVLHTSAGTLGYDHPLGDLDFYANGGSLQMACGSDSTCAHQYAYVYYAESVRRDAEGGNQFVGTKCGSYEDATILSCTGANDVHFGGSDVKTTESGIYVFITNITPPFARG